ncbi:TorD/DmsD family molecular chaperone [Bacillus sp. B-jedd]|uniref:TorD/DmsD family molecular chaperone n=1 Tax=Bacillus sp. B-jedd TaxID=1476857 RepID=UPI000515726F|nr:molecular chaperone TorD family protein [Bacillus sp. B-jedd]CEG27508.1 cytoplasmic chaperone TorD family protein [Bacillus sp. B-jedd]
MALLKEECSVSELMEARWNLYQLLHWLFSAPLDSRSIDSFNQFGNVESLGELGRGGLLLKEFFTSPADLLAERVEFSRLFIGPGSLPAPPWESFYTSSEQNLFDEAMYKVREHYHGEDLIYEKENNEPDDHLLLEIEFMLHLISQSTKQSDQHQIAHYLKKQNEFLMQHLGNWVKQFGEMLAESTESKLYSGAAYLAADFITSDMQYVKELMEGMADD